MFDNFDPNEALERAAFDDYDPNQDMDSYDNAAGPASAPKPRMRKPASVLVSAGQRANVASTPNAQFDLTIINDDTVSQNIELFNAQEPITEVANNQWNPSLIPVLSARQITVRNAAGTGTIVLTAYATEFPPTTLVAYWGLAGELIYATANGSTSIQCEQISYRSLVRYSLANSFVIAKMRMKFSNSLQINNNITYRRKNFLGAATTNNISVASYFRPDQFQSLIVDVPTNILITNEVGLFYNILAANTVNMSIFITKWSKNVG